MGEATGRLLLLTKKPPPAKSAAPGAYVNINRIIRHDAVDVVILSDAAARSLPGAGSVLAAPVLAVERTVAAG
jgi:hypothetical protein